MKYAYMGLTPDSLHDGRPVGFGDVVDITPKQAADNARLFDAGLLHARATGLRRPSSRKPTTKETSS